MKLYLLFITGFLVLVLGISSASAHTTVEIESYEIEIGWGIEPPVVGFRNDFVFEISELGESEGVKSGVNNAFKNLEAIAHFGGITKNLDINSDPRPGHYFSTVIPTRTGSITIELKGDINGVPVDVQIPIEDVESTAVLDFPPTTGPSSGQDVTALKNAMSSLQKDVIDIKSKLGGASTGSVDFEPDTSYNFAVFAISLSTASIVIAIIAMVKRK